jgi:hypothetical protein
MGMYSKFIVMNVTTENMINNSIKIAEYKLNQHKVQGVKSTLDVFQVAQLMDTIKYGESVKLPQNSSIFYNISAN